MTDDAGPIIREVFIDAPPNVVFAYLTKPELFTRWMGLSTLLEPEPGGVFRVDPNGVDVITGSFVEARQPERVVFTWGWEGEGRLIPAGASTVVITLTRQDSGTLLRLEHYLIPAEARKQHEFGWAHYLARLALASTGADPGADPYANASVRHG